MYCDKVTEFFLKHPAEAPALARRVRAIGEKRGISPDRTSEAIEDDELTE